MLRTAAVCVAMAILLLVGCVGGLSVSAAEKPTGYVLYVATDGNDAWSGKLPAPN
ncbi:hypothetical protein HQ576_00260, partial [bacterium]|nr:hypothetical protein [bacterium]